MSNITFQMGDKIAKFTSPPIHQHYNFRTDMEELCSCVVCPLGFVGIEVIGQHLRTQISSLSFLSLSLHRFCFFAQPFLFAVHLLCVCQSVCIHHVRQSVLFVTFSFRCSSILRCLSVLVSPG